MLLLTLVTSAQIQDSSLIKAGTVVEIINDSTKIVNLEQNTIRLRNDVSNIQLKTYTAGHHLEASGYTLIGSFVAAGIGTTFLFLKPNTYMSYIFFGIGGALQITSGGLKISAGQKLRQ